MLQLSIIVCAAAFLALLWLVRRDRASLGLSLTYMTLLLLNHVPGAYAHLVDAGQLGSDEYTTIGIGFTALGAVAFVVGVALAQRAVRTAPIEQFADRRRFNSFCLVVGWFMVYGLTPLRSLPSLGAAIEKGSAIWILGVILALRFYFRQRDWGRAALWFTALGVYPVMMLVLGGFLSYGATAIITACTILAVSTRSNWRVLAGLVLAIVLGLSLFVNYYANRDAMRATVWSNAGVAARVEANLGMFTDFKLFDPRDPQHLRALDERLNQNFFIGVAQKRLEGGQVDYLRGRSVEDALLSLVPRAIWPSKPVYGGSPAIVSEMTGIRLNLDTSFGVGQVMELQVNFGALGVGVGFILLGFLIGLLDTKAAMAEARGDLGGTILLFLPCAALLQPVGSLVELSGGAAAALIAALGWRWAWDQWGGRDAVGGSRLQRRARPTQPAAGPP